MFEFIKKIIIRNRHLHIVILISILTFVLLVRLFDWQIVNGKYLDYESSRGYYATRPIPAQRGKIYDRNGKLIATNRTGYDVQIIPNTLEASVRNRMYLELVKILEKNGDSYEKKFEKFIKIKPYAYGSYLAACDAESLQSWKEKNVVVKADIDKLKDPESIFKYMRETLFKIDDSYTDEEAYKIMCIAYEVKDRGVSASNPLVIASDVSIETMSEIETRHVEFPGIVTQEVYYRQYNDARTVAHLLGYVRAMSGEEYNNIYKDKGYSLDEIVGKEGVEKAAEEYLRGTKGLKTVYVDKNGREISEISSEPPIPGDDLYLTIDLDLQKVALESLMKNIELISSQKDNKSNYGDCNAGSVVVSNPKTGEVLAMVSFPDFDPNIFLAPKTDAAAQKAISDLYTDSTKSASLNRATQGLYAPGSTFKLLTGIAGLEEKIFTEKTLYHCTKIKEYQGHPLKCMSTHGHLNLKTAITKSCNIYFYDAGIDIGINKLDKWMKVFGLGEPTGIEIPEYKGSRSNIETMKIKDKDKTHVWGIADTAQTSIGQLYHQYTPLQLVNYVSAYGNGGYLNKSYLIQKTVKYNGTVSFETKPSRTKINVSSDNLKKINDGMLGVINDANNRVEELFKGFPIQVAGKTGTPETGMEAFGKSSNGVFVCYAPANDPEIAISIVLEHGVWGSNATPIAKDILEKYFNLGDHKTSEYNLEPQEPTIIP